MEIRLRTPEIEDILPTILPTIVTQKKSHRIRTQPGLWGLGLGLMVLATACADRGSAVVPTVWNDPDLPNHPDRGLTSLQIRLDLEHDPAGSVRMETCYDKPGKFRVASREISPRPGPGPDYYLVDKTFDHDVQCYPNVWPVSPIDVGDVERVYLGVGDTDEELSTNVREYEVIKTGAQTLDVRSVGLLPAMGKPGTLKIRDAPTH